MKQQKALEGAPAASRATTSACCSHQNPYLYTRDTFSTSASKVAEENRVQKGAGNGAAGSILWGLGRGWAEDRQMHPNPPNPRAHPREQLPTQLTIERVPRDQLGRDEERAQLLDQPRVGEAAPPSQGVPVQRGDALGHEEAPIGCVAGQKGSLEVHGPRASPCADVLHGCWGGTTVTARNPEHPHTRNRPSSPKLPPWTDRTPQRTNHLLPQEAGAAGLSGGHTAFCRRWKGCLGFVPSFEPPCPAFPPPSPGRHFPPEEKLWRHRSRCTSTSCPSVGSLQKLELQIQEKKKN